MARDRTTVEINDIASLELLNDPLRMRIISLLDEPKPVRSVAGDLGVPVTRLYYHFNLLEEAGLIRIAETRKVGAMIQKLYEASGTDYRPGKGLLAAINDQLKFAEVATATVLDGARIDAEEGLVGLFEEYGPGGTPEDVAKTVAIGRAIFTIPRDRIPEYVQKLHSLVEELEDDHPDSGEGNTELFAFTYLMFPVAGKF